MKIRFQKGNVGDVACIIMLGVIEGAAIFGALAVAAFWLGLLQ